MIGNYKILKEIGEGGFGKTYLALHTILNKKVVIKQSLYKSIEAQKILLNEAFGNKSKISDNNRN